MNRTRNGITQEPFNKSGEVYRISSPVDPNAYYLVKKNSLLTLLGNNSRTRIPTITALNALIRAVNNNRMTHIGHMTLGRLDVPIKKNMLTAFRNHTPKKNYILQKWNDNYGLVPLRDPLYGRNLHLKRISFNQLTNNNIRNARTVKRNNVRQTNKFYRNQAEKLIKKMVQKIIFKNNYPNVWMNSNGREINAPLNANVNRYGRQGGPKVEPHILKHMNRLVNSYLRKNPTLKTHYIRRTIMIKK